MITSGNLVLKYNFDNFWKLSFEVQFLNKRRSQVKISYSNNFVTSLYFLQCVGYILEYILNRKSSGHET